MKMSISREISEKEFCMFLQKELEEKYGEKVSFLSKEEYARVILPETLFEYVTVGTLKVIIYKLFESIKRNDGFIKRCYDNDRKKIKELVFGAIEEIVRVEEEARKEEEEKIKKFITIMTCYGEKTGNNDIGIELTGKKAMKNKKVYEELCELLDMEHGYTYFGIAGEEYACFYEMELSNTGEKEGYFILNSDGGELEQEAKEVKSGHIFSQETGEVAYSNKEAIKIEDIPEAELQFLTKTIALEIKIDKPGKYVLFVREKNKNEPVMFFQLFDKDEKTLEKMLREGMENKRKHLCLNWTRRK